MACNSKDYILDQLIERLSEVYEELDGKDTCKKILTKLMLAIHYLENFKKMK